MGERLCPALIGIVLNGEIEIENHRPRAACPAHGAACQPDVHSGFGGHSLHLGHRAILRGIQMTIEHKHVIAHRSGSRMVGVQRFAQTRADDVCVDFRGGEIGVAQRQSARYAGRPRLPGGEWQRYAAVHVGRKVVENTGHAAIKSLTLAQKACLVICPAACRNEQDRTELPGAKQGRASGSLGITRGSRRAVRSAWTGHQPLLCCLFPVTA